MITCTYYPLFEIITYFNLYVIVFHFISHTQYHMEYIDTLKWRNNSFVITLLFIKFRYGCITVFSSRQIFDIKHHCGFLNMFFHSGVRSRSCRPGCLSNQWYVLATVNKERDYISVDKVIKSSQPLRTIGYTAESGTGPGNGIEPW